MGAYWFVLCPRSFNSSEKNHVGTFSYCIADILRSSQLSLVVYAFLRLYTASSKERVSSSLTRSDIGHMDILILLELSIRWASASMNSTIVESRSFAAGQRSFTVATSIACCWQGERYPNRCPRWALRRASRFGLCKHRCSWATSIHSLR